MKKNLDSEERKRADLSDLQVQRLRGLITKIKTEYYYTLRQTEALRQKAKEEQWTSTAYQERLCKVLNGKKNLQSYREHQESLIQEYEHQLIDSIHSDLTSQIAPYQVQSVFQRFQQGFQANTYALQHYLVEQKVPHIAGLFLLIVVLGFFTYTGYVAKDAGLFQTIPIETTFTENTTIPLNLTDLSSLRANGRLIGKPSVHLYLEAENGHTQKTQRYVLLDGDRLGLDMLAITGNAVRQNQGITFVFTTDQEKYTIEEMVYVVLAPSNSYYSMYLTDSDNNTIPIESLNFTVQRPGDYQLVGLLTQDGVSERLETRFHVDAAPETEGTTPISSKKATEKPRGLYSFQNYCQESCHLPTELVDPRLVIEINDNTRVTLYNLTYSQHTLNEPPKQIKNIPDTVSYLGYSTPIDLNSYFQDEDELIYTTSATELSAHIEKGILNLQGNKTGSYSLFVYASDGNAIITSKPFTITVKEPPIQTQLTLNCEGCKMHQTKSYTETWVRLNIQKNTDRKIGSFYLDLPAGWRVTDPKDGTVNVIDEKHPRIQWTLKKESDVIEKNFYALAPNTQKKLRQSFSLTVADQKQDYEVITHPTPIDLREEEDELDQRLDVNTSINTTGDNYTVTVHLPDAEIRLENVYDLEEIQSLDLFTQQNITLNNQIYLAATPLIHLNTFQLNSATFILPKTNPVKALAGCERWNTGTQSCEAWNLLNTSFNETPTTLQFTVKKITAYAGLGKRIGEIKSKYKTSKIGAYTDYTLNNETYANYTHPLLYPGKDSFSAEFWIRTNSTKDQTFLSSEEGQFETYWKIGMDMARYGILAIRLSSQEGETIKEIPDALVDGPQSFGTTLLNDGQWHHLLAVRDRNQNTILGYVDGKLDLTYNDTSTDIMDTASHLILGRSNPNSDAGYDGEFTLIDLYDHALTPEEMQSHYQTQKSLFTEVKA
ncbi:MAG: LamG domain-containing protein [Nanoarchaeota archaeon]